MKFSEMWLLSALIRGENPIIKFISGILFGFWIPLTAIAVLTICLNFATIMHNPLMFFPLYFYTVWVIVSTFVSTFWNAIAYCFTHPEEVQCFFRRLFLFDC
jgi:hypothetical protein